MKVVFEQDSYVASTWGHAEHFKAGEPKEVGTDFGVLCLQNGAKEYEEPKVEQPKAKAPAKKKTVAKKKVK